MSRDARDEVLPGHARAAFRLSWPFLILIGLVLTIILSSLSLAFDWPLGYILPVVLVLISVLARTFGRRE